MKQLFLFIIPVIMFFTACKKDSITGNGPVQTELRSLTGFTKIEVEGRTGITVKQSSNFLVEVKAYSNLLSQLETKVVQGVLKIGYKPGARVINDNSEVYITLPALDKFYTSGSSEVLIQNGTASTFEAVVIGAGKIRAFGFSTNDAAIKIEGSGVVELSIVNKLHAKITGSGQVLYKGNPASVTTDITGSGTVVKQ